MSYTMRISCPYNNKYYIRQANGGYNGAVQGKPTKLGANVLSNCVGYANGRFNEIGNYGFCKYQLTCNAENFIERAKALGLKISNTPTLGGIMVWQKGGLGSGDGAGHVAIVERIDSSNQIYTSESSWNGSAFYNSIRTNNNGRWGAGSNYKYRGCIVNPAVSNQSNQNSGGNTSWKIIPQRATFTSSVNGLRIRRSPSLSGEVVGSYDKGQSLNYDGYVDNDGIRWVTYIGRSGHRNYVARRKLDNSKIYGTCK